MTPAQASAQAHRFAPLSTEQRASEAAWTAMNSCLLAAGHLETPIEALHAGIISDEEWRACIAHYKIKYGVRRARPPERVA